MLAIELLAKAISNTRSGTNVEPQLAEQLANELIKLSIKPYSSLANKPGYKLVAKTIAWGHSKPRKYVGFQLDDTFIAITKAKLAPAKQSKCKLCGQIGCNKAKNLSTLRKTIEHQLAEFKAGYKARLEALIAIGSFDSLAEARKLNRCALTGVKLSKGQVHVDHAVPFSQLVQDWCSAENISLCELSLWLKPNSYLLANWANWHREYAIFQLTSAKANLSKNAKVQISSNSFKLADFA